MFTSPQVFMTEEILILYLITTIIRKKSHSFAVLPKKRYKKIIIYTYYFVCFHIQEDLSWKNRIILIMFGENPKPVLLLEQEPGRIFKKKLKKNKKKLIASGLFGLFCPDLQSSTHQTHLVIAVPLIYR